MKRRFCCVYPFDCGIFTGSYGYGSSFFRAERAAAMQVVNDGDGLIALTGDGNYARKIAKETGTGFHRQKH